MDIKWTYNPTALTGRGPTLYQLLNAKLHDLATGFLFNLIYITYYRGSKSWTFCGVISLMFFPVDATLLATHP